QVFDFGKMDDGTLYIVMEFVEGQSVAAVIEREGPMDPARVAKILQQTCGSLEEAHNMGIIHRDLKPDNVVLCEKAGQKDWVEVLDFGIAKRSSEVDEREQKLTQQGMVLGTPPYMSPEQFTGKPVDRRSDIYSLAVMAYEMLTGGLPFSGNTAWEWATAHMTAAPRPLETFPTGGRIPPAMRGAILRGLEKDPNNRFPTVTAFFEAFASGAGAAAAIAPVPQGAGYGRGQTQVGAPIEPGYAAPMQGQTPPPGYPTPPPGYPTPPGYAMGPGGPTPTPGPMPMYGTPPGAAHTYTPQPFPQAPPPPQKKSNGVLYALVLLGGLILVGGGGAFAYQRFAKSASNSGGGGSTTTATTATTTTPTQTTSADPGTTLPPLESLSLSHTNPPPTATTTGGGGTVATAKKDAGAAPTATTPLGFSTGTATSTATAPTSTVTYTPTNTATAPTYTAPPTRQPFICEAAKREHDLAQRTNDPRALKQAARLATQCVNQGGQPPF
ncbi:MAG TPA: serine/threonine-protein kinase, partial [Polyangiaceae bacterium]|nr:serine/threonine-protein kinase [Polyangiaceae bacterium]